MRVLAIDTALGACAACVVQGLEALATESIAMERGHAEALLPLLDRVISRVDGGFSSIDRVAVTVGPGSYTGLRVGLSAARAVGLACDRPVLGVTTLSALLAPLLSASAHSVLAAAIDARHGQVYLQAIGAGGGTIIAPALMSVVDAVRLLGSGPVTLIGSGAPALAARALGAGVKVFVFDAPVAPAIEWVARLGTVADPSQALPRPVYLRGAEAKPQDHARLPRR